MKVAVVCEWLDAWRGGAETSTLQYLHHLRAKGVEVHVYTRSRLAAAPDLHVHVVNGAAMTRTRRSMTFAFRVEHMLQRESFDVVHAVSPCRGADVYQPRGGLVAESIERNLALLNGKSLQRLKRYANRFNFRQRHQLALERKMIGDPSGPQVVAISNYVARQLKEHYGLTDDRIHLIYNGVDADDCSAEDRARNRDLIRREYGIGPDDYMVILVAHNFRLKGVARWLEAAECLRANRGLNFRSLIIGKGESRKWHQMAARLGVQDVVTFVGPTDRVPAFYHAADVLVHPTYYDPCSRVVLEAMVSGLPVVATRWDGASEMIVEGENGFVLQEPADVALLVDRVVTLHDPNLRRRMGEAGRAIAPKVSMARNAEAMIQLFEKLSKLERVPA